MVGRRALAHFRQFPPQPNSTTPTAFPAHSLSLCPGQPLSLSKFLSRCLKPQFCPSDLLRILQKLRHHPSLSAFDLTVFRWASTVDSFRHDHSTFEYMIRTLTGTNRIDDLENIINLMISHPCPCSDGIFACNRIKPIYLFAINVFCRAGRLDRAEKLLEDLKKSIDGKPGITVYNMLIDGYCKIGRHERVLEVYGTILRERVKPDEITFNVLINSRCRSGGFDSVMDLFKEMKAKNCNPNLVTFNTLIGGFMRMGKVNDGIALAREMLDLGYKLSAATCEILIRGLCSKARVSEAWDLLIEFLERGDLPGDFDCLDLVQYLCVEGEIDKAMDLVSRIPNPGAVIYAAVIDKLGKLGRIEEAVLLTGKMIQGDLAPDVITFNGLLGQMCRRGRAVEAEKMMAAARRIGFLPDRSTYEILAGGFAREGRRKEGEEIVDQMVEEEFIGDIHDYNRLMNRMDLGRKLGPKQSVKGNWDCR